VLISYRRHLRAWRRVAFGRAAVAAVRPV